MANPEHLAILRQGSIKWNKWREENPNLKPDLNGADIRILDLIEANFSEAELAGANLIGAYVRANFRGAFLIKANLSGAVLLEADFRGALLTEVDFSGAILSKADFRGAGLAGAIFRGAKLQNANLSDTFGLSAEQFGDTNLSGADLPQQMKEFKRARTVEELSASSRNLFLTGLLACLVSWLTISSTTDAQLLANSASLSLPIIGTKIPIVGFFLLGPVLLFCFFLYFLFNLQRLWEGLSELPAVFPDGVSLDDKYSTWLFNIRVFVYFSNLKNKKPPLFKLQLFLTSLLTWWPVPFVLYLFWGRYLCRHDNIITIVQLSILALSVLAGSYFYFLSCSTLRARKEKISFRNKNLIGFTVCIGVITLLLSSYSFRIGEGWLRYFLPIRIITNIGIKTNINISNMDVSTKPENWLPLYKEKDLYLWVKGAELSNRNLRHLIGSKAFLINANLEKADLMLAVLSDADLRNANLTQANLMKANLSGANLSGADLKNAVLKEADLRGANLSGANLKNAVLKEANLRSANLGGADVSWADFELADFGEKKIGDIKGGFGTEKPANLTEANLTGANLTYADLNKVNLRGANFFRTILTKADLCEADLLDAKNLTIGQLSTSFSLGGAKMDPSLETQIKEKFPKLMIFRGFMWRIYYKNKWLKEN
jgi:uncharacterized protein YjbI with pentapeptide repeats